MSLRWAITTIVCELSLKIPDGFQVMSRKKRFERKVRGLVCEIELPKGARLETGKPREELGQLEGRAYKEATLGSEGTSDRLKVEWIVRAPKGGKVKVIARHERAGMVRTELELK